MHRITKILLITAIGILGITASKAQSTSASSPTPLSSSFSGKGPNKETDYYFSVSGGPGQVSVTLQLSAKQYSTFARVEVTDAGGNTLATLNMDASTGTGTSQQVRSFDLPTKQTVRLKLTLDANLDTYTISTTGGTTGALVAGRRTATAGGRPASTSTRDNGVRPTGPTVSNGTAASSTSSTRAAVTDPRARPDAVSGGAGTLRQNMITVRCPSTYVAAVQLPAGWSAPFGGQFKRNLVEAAVSNSQITCTYGETFDLTLISPVPKGYTCDTGNTGAIHPREVYCEPTPNIQLKNPN
jgi:hypothetical protein